MALCLPRRKNALNLPSNCGKFVIDKFPEYGRRYSYAGVIGIPGFWQDANGIVQLWKPREYKMPMLVIPYKNNRGLIQGCQLRLHQGDISEGEKRYRWLASPLECNGCSSGTPIHFTFNPSTLFPGKTVLIPDHITNPAVCRQLARLIAAREQDAVSHNLSTTTGIVSWEGYKGIDDAAKAANVIFTMLSIPEWFANLAGGPREEVKKVWNEIGYKSLSR